MATRKKRDDPRTARAKGPRLKQLRKARGWTHEAAAAQTDRLVTEAAEAEKAAGQNNGTFSRRVASREKQGASPGLSKGTIASVEGGGRSFLTTFVILAKLYGTTIADLCHLESDEVDSDDGEASLSSDKDSPGDAVAVEKILREESTVDDTSLTDRERERRDLLERADWAGRIAKTQRTAP